MQSASVSHSYQARISKAHRYVAVLLHELENRLHLLGKIEGDAQRVPAEQRAQRGATARAEKMERLGRAASQVVHGVAGSTPARLPTGGGCRGGSGAR